MKEVTHLLRSERWHAAADESGHVMVRTVSSMLERQKEVPLGLKLLRIGIRTAFSSVEEVLKTLRFTARWARFVKGQQASVPLEFELGLDLRSCWGNLEDLEGHPVCGEEVMKDLHLKVASMEQPKMDSAGQSGSTIVTNLRNHIIKSSNREEYHLMEVAMPKIQKSIEERYTKFGGCWSTGLAPFCAALIEPSDAGSLY
eukprot:CAMPEP_0115518852 /NCGR_PEP_ID=MMETSP0271-20121206/78114_1 /TAXON_ID=71861 /ORGANISM="Scrippsiella trochoidea, Strain CCMP3099" /LENGTH=199 /DNA_ID=CAMNT_0002949805 /DNA_START=96 /DNA_END=692 /DNA_ORIENTATION=+